MIKLTLTGIHAKILTVSQFTITENNDETFDQNLINAQQYFNNFTINQKLVSVKMY